MSYLYRLCKEKVEKVTHVISSCSVPAGNQYRKRHNKHGKKVHRAKNVKLNVKTNDSCINQSQSWRMKNVTSLGLYNSDG